MRSSRSSFWFEKEAVVCSFFIMDLKDCSLEFYTCLLITLSPRPLGRSPPAVAYYYASVLNVIVCGWFDGMALIELCR